MPLASLLRLWGLFTYLKVDIGVNLCTCKLAEAGAFHWLLWHYWLGILPDRLHSENSAGCEPSAELVLRVRILMKVLLTHALRLSSDQLYW
jgi:hypothetical protein